MSHPLDALRELLAPSKKAMTGVVVSTDGTPIVSTSGGTIAVSSLLPVNVGDTVVVYNGVIQRKAQSLNSLRVYHL